MLFFLSPWSPLEVTFLKKIYFCQRKTTGGGMAMITNFVFLVVESSSLVITCILLHILFYIFSLSDGGLFSVR